MKKSFFRGLILVLLCIVFVFSVYAVFSAASYTIKALEIDRQYQHDFNIFVYWNVSVLPLTTSILLSILSLTVLVVLLRRGFATDIFSLSSATIYELRDEIRDKKEAKRQRQLSKLKKRIEEIESDK